MHHQISPCPSPSLRTRHPHHNEEPLIIENWKKEKELGSGAFGVITLWKNVKTNEFIAIKQCKNCTTTGIQKNIGPVLITKQQRERWKHEVDLMQRLNHPNVVKSVPVPPCLEPRVPQPLPSLGMEYCSGGDLRQVINKPEHCCGLPEWSVRLILSQISSALLYLHAQRIIHRDVKPENIVLKLESNGTITYKIIDLGYCKELDQTCSLASSFVGTMQYLAPELFENKQYTAAVDNWSFGLLAHEILTGNRPFLPNSTPGEWLPIVIKKKAEIIGATIDNVTGQITYHNSITLFNHVSCVFKSDLENWLRIVLQKDPEKRGGKEAFTILSSFLNKPVIKVYSVQSLQLFTYELTDGMKIQELKVLIESNTRLNCKDQILLIPSYPGLRPRSILIAGDSLDEQMLSQCLTMKSRFDSHVDIVGDTIYLFHRSHPLSFAQYSVTSLIPPSEESVLLNPTNLVTFQEHVSTASNFVWVAQELILKYNRLIGAHQALINYCLQLFQTVKSKETSAVKSVTKLLVTMDLVEQQISTSIANIKTFRPSKTTSNIDFLLNNYDDALSQVKNVTEVKSSLEKFTNKLNEQYIILFNLTTKSVICNFFDPFSSKVSKDCDQFYLIYSSIVQAFDDIRKMTRNDRLAKTKAVNSPIAFDNTYLVKLICDLFQLAEKLVKNVYNELTKLLELSASFNVIGKEFRKISQQADSQFGCLKHIHNSLLHTQWLLVSHENSLENNSRHQSNESNCSNSAAWLSALNQVEEQLSKIQLQSTIGTPPSPNTALLSPNLTDLNSNT